MFGTNAALEKMSLQGNVKQKHVIRVVDGGIDVSKTFISVYFYSVLQRSSEQRIRLVCAI